MSETLTDERLQRLHVALNRLERASRVGLSEGELPCDTLYEDMKRVCQAARLYLKSIEPPEPLPPCVFCGCNYDLGRAFDKHVCATCWNSGLRRQEGRQ